MLFFLLKLKKKHPDFDQDTLQNDIALIKLLEPAELNQYLQVACLENDASNIHGNSIGQVIGWGSSSEFNSFTEFLWNSELDLYLGKYCQSLDPEKTKDWSKQMCAGIYSDYGNSTANCHNDYGSPLYVSKTINGKAKNAVAGLFSYNSGCTTVHSPGVYTKVDAYYDWIMTNKKTRK